MRKWILTLSLAALAVPLDASALGLGDINVRSALNQSFNAEIELLSVRADEVDSLTVTLASSAAFTQAGLDRPAILNQLRFRVEKRANGKPYLHVYTQEPIKEPFLNYLVEVNWASGHLLREYTVLLDPPFETVAERPSVQASPSGANSTAPPQFSSKSLFEASPNSESLPSKPKLRDSRPKDSTAGDAQTSESQLSSARAKVTSDGSNYGPTQRGEGLWSIAKSLLPSDGSADVNQMMVGLLKANPEAFFDNNINLMKSGHILRVPTPDEWNALNRQEALSEVNQQTARWKTSNSTLSDIAKQESAPNPTETASSPDTASSSAQLKLVPATDAPVEGTVPDNKEQTAAAEKQAMSGESGAPVNSSAPQAVEAVGENADPANIQATPPAAETGMPDLETLNKDLALATESLEAKRLENEEMSSRLAELESQAESAQRLLALKNEELAALKEPVDEAGSANTAAPASITNDEAQQPEANANAEAEAAPIAQQPENAAGKAKNIVDNGLVLLRKGMDELSHNPMVQGITALAALLVVSLLWIVGRRRRINRQFIGNPASPNIMSMTPASAAPIVQQAAAISAETADQSQLQPENKYEEALADPEDRHEVQLKLLDIYHLTNSKNAFAAQAEALYADLGGKGGAVWDKVVIMGREVCPEHPLFSIGDESALKVEHDALPEFFTESSTAAAASDEPQDIAAVTGSNPSFWEEDITPATDNSIEFESTAFELPASSMDEQETPAASASYDLVAASHELEIEAPASAEFISEPEPTMPDSDFNLDYKFDFDLEEEADSLAKANAQSVIPEDDQASNGLDFDSGLLIDSDEVSTKLELARAYIEMGDPEGAQSILDEVMKEGDDEQKQEAQALMQKVG